MTTLPTPQFISPQTDSSQYRPAIDASATMAIYECTPIGGGDTKLYSLDPSQTSPQPQPFFPASLDAPNSRTRADICWSTGDVALNGASANNEPVSVLTANNSGSQIITRFSGSTGWSYPQWSADGSTLTVMNAAPSASPRPCTSQVDSRSGTVTIANLDGMNGSASMYGGMPAVNPNNALSIAYAGQPQASGWHGQPPGYQQDYNYIFINSGTGPFESAQLEPDAPTTAFDPAYQGRAPAWSPDGRYLVFESNRLGRGYALFLFDTHDPSAQAVLLIDSSYGAQHAKFFPDGNSLILCARPSPGAPMAIATLDISSFL